MRTIRVNGVKCDVSKSEADFARRIPIFAADQRARMVAEWLNDAPTHEAKERRTNVANAVGLLIVGNVFV